MLHLNALQDRWFARLARRASQHGANPTVPQLRSAADQTIRNIQRPMPDNRWAKFDNPENLPGHMTVRQFLASQPRGCRSPQYWFGHNKEIEYREWVLQDGAGEYLRNSYLKSEAAYTISFTCQGYEQDSVLVANWRYLHEEYKDLFAYGLLVDQDCCVLILMDKPYYDEYQLENLMEEIQNVQDHIMFDEGLVSEVEMAWQEQTVKDEVESFIDKLEIEPTLQATLFPTKEEDWREKIDWDKAIFTKFDIECHIWEVIRTSDEPGHKSIEFGDDGTYLDIKEVAQQSPLYRMGREKIEKQTDAIYTISDKVTTYASQHPQLRDLMSFITGDLLTAAEGKLSEQAFYF